MRVQTFSKDISSKGNIILRLKLELTYFEATVKLFNHYTTLKNGIYLLYPVLRFVIVRKNDLIIDKPIAI